MVSWRIRSFGLALSAIAIATPGLARGEGGGSGTTAVPATSPVHDVSRELFEVGLAIGIDGRRFSYTDPVSINLRDYRSGAATMPGFFASLYPAARTRLPLIRDLGVFVDGAHALGLSSATSDGKVVTTSFDRFHVGLRERFRPGPPGLVLGISGGLAVTVFDFGATGALATQVPSVAYDALRLAADARLPAGPVAVLIAAGYDGPLGAGAVHDRFRAASVGGLDASLGVAVPIGSGFEGRLTASYARFFYTFAPKPGDAFVAGGALDELFGITLGAAYAY